MNRNDPVEMNAFPILFSDDFKFRVLHAETLAPEADLAVNDELGSCCDAFMEVEQVKPPERNPGGECRTGKILQLGLKAAHPTEASGDCLSHRAAQAKRAFVGNIRKMIKAFPILMTPWVMLKQSPECRDAEFAEGGELRTSQPAQILKRNRREMRGNCGRLFFFFRFLGKLFPTRRGRLWFLSHG